MGVRAVKPLPHSFLFGVATSDHQGEAYDPEHEDIRDVWERELGQIPRGRGTDFQVRYPDDIALARDLGCRLFRFSLAWSRIEPSPGVFDQCAIDHYVRVADNIHASGMESVVTLHHFTWPVHIQEQGGMTGNAFPDLFERYTARMAEAMASTARFWITFNEPSQLVFGYLKPWWESDYPAPPGLPPGSGLDDQIDAVGKLIRNLFRAHAAARDTIRRANPEALVGANPLLLGVPAFLQRWMDNNACRIKNVGDLRRSGARVSKRPLQEHGAADMVLATLTRTRDRERLALFSRPYHVAAQALLARVDSPVRAPADLAGKTLVVVRATTAQVFAARRLPLAALHAVRSHAVALRHMERGTADGYLADDTILTRIVARNPGLYRLAARGLTAEPYAAALSPGSQDLLDVVNDVIRQRDAGAGTGPGDAGAGPHGTPRTLPGRAIKRIRRRGYLVAAVMEDVEGFSARDTRGEYRGLEVDLAREVARRILGDPGRVRFVAAATPRRISAVRSVTRALDPLFKAWSTLSIALSSNWWHLGMAGRLPEFLCPTGCAGKQDFVGVDYYWGVSTPRIARLLRLVDAAAGRFDRAPVWPRALYRHLRSAALLQPGLPILVVENGSVPRADGVDRTTYLRSHIREVQRALSAGANVVGYICWSITSNREWGLPFDRRSDFGLYHIDLDTDPELRRTPTPSAQVFRSIIQGRTAD